MAWFTRKNSAYDNAISLLNAQHEANLAEMKAQSKARQTEEWNRFETGEKEMESMLGTWQPGKGWVGAMREAMDTAGADQAELSTSTGSSLRIGSLDSSNEEDVEFGFR